VRNELKISNEREIGCAMPSDGFAETVHHAGLKEKAKSGRSPESDKYGNTFRVYISGRTRETQRCRNTWKRQRCKIWVL
jgi:hypothetical protein